MLEPRRGQLGVSDSVLDIPMAEIGLQGASIMTVVRELVPTCVTQHVWVDLEPELRLRARSLDRSCKPRGRERGSART
jgi:hypothetical protein